MNFLRIKLVVLNILTAILITVSVASIIPGVSDIIEPSFPSLDSTTIEFGILEA